MKIKLLNGAKADIRDIHKYITTRDSKEAANTVVLAMKELINNLKHLPDRGSPVKELETVGIQEYRQLYYKPYRIIYSVEDDIVYIFAVIDGRRDLQAILTEIILKRYSLNT